MAIQFQQNYQLLELDPTSNWEMANKNYRRLVHIWHPDRFAQRPRERIHAQQQFIELTKAFNNLRAFYRENHRLPYEQIRHSVADSPEPPQHQQVVTNDESLFKTGILNKRKPSTKTLQASAMKPLLWILPTCAIILGAFVAFFLIDRSAKLNTIEEATRVLSTAEPSEYNVDNEGISRVNSRAVLLDKSSDGSIGERLGKDLFR